MSKILLAEDDTDMRRFLVKALQNAGFDVTSYDNGLSAYQRLREEPFELLLTDIVMPEMDGIELARRAAELDPDIKIMFITGFAAVALNADSTAPKHAKVLSKPIHLRDLVNEVTQDAGGLELPASLAAALPRQFGADKTRSTKGRVAQRKSTSLTWRGSQVRSLSRPPFPLMDLPVTRPESERE